MDRNKQAQGEKPELNIAAIDRIIDKLKRDKTFAFDMSKVVMQISPRSLLLKYMRLPEENWDEEHWCGTVACLAGLAHIDKCEQEGKDWQRELYNIVCLGQYLGLDTMETNSLFFAQDCMRARRVRLSRINQLTRRRAIKVMENLKKKRIVDWFVKIRGERPIDTAEYLCKPKLLHYNNA